MANKNLGAEEPKTWIDRLGIPVPEDLLSDSELTEVTTPKTGFQSQPALTNTQMDNNSSESSLSDQEAAELQEYLRQSSLHEDNLSASVNVIDANPVGVAESESWSRLNDWSRCSPTKSDQNLAILENDDDGWAIEEEQADYSDEYFGQSPPVPRTGFPVKHTAASRNRKKFDNLQTRRSTTAPLRPPRRKKDEVLKFTSLPLQPSTSNTLATAQQVRSTQQRERTRHREKDRGAKSADQQLHEAPLSPPCEHPASPPPHSPATSSGVVLRCESLPQLKRLPKQTGHRCRYLSVSSRRLSEPAPSCVPPPSPLLPVPPSPTLESPPLPQDCMAQYAHVSSLLRRTNAGGPDAAATSPTGGGRKFSHEEMLYQQEASETLWLELQAWHAQLDCYTYDNLLFAQRDKVNTIIDAVLNFSIPVKSYTDTTCPSSCLSIWCSSCRDHQDKALRQVSNLMSQIEQVEALFPSTAKIIILYPAWGGPEFTTRCRALSLWYNTTIHLRQTIALLGNRLQHIAKSVIPWPTFRPVSEILSSSNSTTQRTFSSEDEITNRDTTMDSSSFDQDGHKNVVTSVCSPIKLIINHADDSEISNKIAGEKAQNEVRFAVEGSTSSDEGEEDPDIKDDKRDRYADAGRSDSNSSLLSAEAPVDSGGLKKSSSTLFLASNPYRKYVEKCMHSKGLHKTFEKIVEVIRDVMARTVCLMEDEPEHLHPLHTDRFLLEYCAELRRVMQFTEDVRSSVDVADVNTVLPQDGVVPMAPLTAEFEALSTGDHRVKAAADGENQRSNATGNRTSERGNDSPNGSTSKPNAARSCPPDCGARNFLTCSWSGRMWLMGLPGVASLFWFLSSVPVLLVCECLRLRLSQMPKQPSQLSIRQLVRECREGLRLAVTVRRRFLRWSGAMAQHLSSLKRRRVSTASQYRSSSISTASTGRGAGEAQRRESAPTPGGPGFPRHVSGSSSSRHLGVPDGSVLTSFSAPASPMRSSAHVTLSHTSARPNLVHAYPQGGSSDQSSPPSIQAPPLLSPLAPLAAQEASGHIFLSGYPSTAQQLATRRLSGEGYDIDLGLCSHEHEQQLQAGHGDFVNIPPSTTYLQDSVSPTVPVTRLNDDLSSNFLDTDTRFTNLHSDTVKNVDLNSTDEGVALTSPESSERSSSAGYSTGRGGENGGPTTAVQTLQALRKELSRRQTNLLEDLDFNIETLLKVYLDWLDLYIPVSGGSNFLLNASSAEDNTSGLLHEWQFVCSICPQVLHAYTLAATRFCNLAELLVKEAWDSLSSGIDELAFAASIKLHGNMLKNLLLNCQVFQPILCSNHFKSSERGQLSGDISSVMSSLSSATTQESFRPNCKRELSRIEIRRLHSVVSGSRRRMGRALALARTLKHQLEVAVQYKRHSSASLQRLLQALRCTGHVRLDRIDPRYAVFAPGHLAQDLDSIMVLLSLTPLPDEHRMNANVAEQPPVPSLLLTSPSSQTKPLLVVPPPVMQTNGTGPFPSATLVPRNSFSSSSDNNKLAYLILLRLDAWMPSEGSVSTATSAAPTTHAAFFPADFNNSSSPPLAVPCPCDSSSIQVSVPSESCAESHAGVGAAKKFSRKLPWRGPVVRLQPTAAATIALSSLQTCDAVAISSSSSVGTVLGYLSSVLPSQLLLPLHERSVPHAAVNAALAALKAVCLEVCGRLGKCVTVVAQLLHLEGNLGEEATTDATASFRAKQASSEPGAAHDTPSPHSPASATSSGITRDVLQQLYSFGFEYHRDVCRLFSSSNASEQTRIVSHLVSFSQSWIKFCQQHYPPGNGSRPRWSANGLDFLLYSCSPQNLRHVHKHAAQSFLNEVQECYHHVVGVAKPEASLPSSAPITPNATRRPFRSTSSSASTRSASDSPSTWMPYIDSRLGPDFTTASSAAVQWSRAQSGRGMARVRNAVVRLEQELQQKRQQSKAVGQVVSLPPSHALDLSPQTRSKTIGFSWHRGFKIGSGQFGKVYTAVNNSTGELLAVKVQPVSHTDRKLVAKMVEELRILEGFSHPNLVKYYGMEILEDELLFFMEYCEEGTLEHLSYSTEVGLPEEMVRRYTRQLLDGVAALHDRGVIHRDIKGANIFLTQDSHNLKLGDFGCAVRLRGDRTEVGELGGIVGTHAFMAPEIFQSQGGYGRAADVWSLACVIIEMCTAKRPWPELNNSAQIMFKVGMGQSPAYPPSLSKEGHDFLSRCFVHDPQERATASSLLHHPFVKVELDEDSYSLPLYSGVQNYYAYNTAFENSS
ncbi:uncharacterized protein LOC108666402 [Hyalella azteca]|uniref:Uncharacterized protein LOC108666402 n=1 Tax=Hyalella azteca TaxID=294128 RepID=A0A979FGS3_HYAAZ|nr:uncharacterized protein LOC108666402 [Hyalella azteca]